MALIARGIARDAARRLTSTTSPAELVAGSGAPRARGKRQSPPLREIATVLMKVSQNLYAETLLKAIGAARGGLGTFAAGDRRAQRAGVVGRARRRVCQRRRFGAVSLQLRRRRNGDRRSRARCTATSVTATRSSPRCRSPARTAPSPTRLLRTRAEGNAVAKTGSISNVRSLSGYVRTRDGEMLVFSILANDFVIPSATVNWIADLAVEHLANFTRER